MASSTQKRRYYIIIINLTFLVIVVFFLFSRREKETRRERMRETRAKGEDAEYDWLVIWRCVLWGGMEQAMVCRRALFFSRLLQSRVSRAQRTSSCFACPKKSKKQCLFCRLCS